MRYVVYEVWTRARVIEAENIDEAYTKGEPEPREDDLSLCNWHAVPAMPFDFSLPPVGGLNYRQES